MVARLILPVIVLIVGAGISWWIIQTPPGYASKTQESQATGAKPQTAQLTRVTTRWVAKQNFSLPLYFYARVESQQQHQILAQTNGKLKAMHPALESGGTVTANEILFQLHDPALAAEIQRANVQVQQASINQQQIAAQIASAGEVPGLQTPQAFRSQQLTQAQAALASARKDYALLEEQLADLSIRAPFDGMVSASPLSLGQQVAVGTQLTNLLSVDHLKTQVDLDPAEKSLIDNVGIKQVAVIAALPLVASAAQDHAYFKGSILGVASGVDLATGLTTAQVELASTNINPADDTKSSKAYTLKPGDQLQVRFNLTPDEPLWRIPLQAFTSDRRFYTVDQDNQVVGHMVDMYYRDQHFAYLKAAELTHLAASSKVQVILSPSSRLVPGVAVNTSSS